MGDKLIDPKKIGVEVELLAPQGSDRKQLADAIAAEVNGSVRAFFHLDSEPSKVMGKPVFYHLTQAFEVLDESGQPLAHCLDDITIQNSLKKKTKPKDGWYRILSDDVRFLRLTMQHADAGEAIEQSLQKLAELFGVAADASEGGVYRVADNTGASIALAAPLPGERERPCELVTMPLSTDDTESLSMLLSCAKESQFQIPEEGATHLHFDGKPFAEVTTFIKTARFLQEYRLVLRRLLGTNFNCRRIGDWSNDFLELIKTDDLNGLDWQEYRKRLSKTSINKYCDFNLRNLIYDIPDKHTLEIRILPSTLDSDYIYRSVRLFKAIFAYLSTVEMIPYLKVSEPSLGRLEYFFDKLALASNDESIWREDYQSRFQ